MKKYLLQVVIEQDEDGIYVAHCPALEGCYSQGDTYEEAMKNIKDVIQMCLEELKEEKKKLDPKYPEIIGLKWGGPKLHYTHTGPNLLVVAVLGDNQSAPHAVSLKKGRINA